MDFTVRRENEVWRKAPFLRLLFPLLAGMLFENKLSIQCEYLIVPLILSIVLIFTCNYISFSSFFELHWVPGIAIHFVVFSFAVVLIHVHRDTQIEQSSYYDRTTSNLLLLRLLDDPVQKQNTWKCTADIKWLVKDHICFNENERIIIHFYRKPDAHQYSGGSLIIFRKRLTPIKNLKSFTDFDYEKYCRLRHIYAEVFLKDNEFAVVQKERKISLFSLLVLSVENC